MGKSDNFETMAIRSQMEVSVHKEHSSPIFMTSSFLFDDAEEARALFAAEKDGNIYTRYSNPSNDELVEKMCLLEGAEAGIATASGMAAMFLSMAAFLNSGDHAVVSRSIFGSTHQIVTGLFPRWNISHTYVDVDRPEDWEKAIQENTRLLYAETPTNPALDILDLEFLGNLARKRDLILVVDNCFATPYLQSPIEWGAHIVAHSTTKFIDGQGRTIGGVIVGRENLMEEVSFMARHTGPAMSPFNGWILSKSLETLAVRMERHCSNALRIAEFLENHSQVAWVKYPFLPSHPAVDIAKKQMRLGGGLVSFEVAGGLERGRRFLDSLEMVSLTANLGDAKTIATHPASTTHSKLTDAERAEVGISPGFVRISAGLEHIDDIITDLARALDGSS